MDLKLCRTTQIELPLHLFPYAKWNHNVSRLGREWCNIHTRTVNGRYKDASIRARRNLSYFRKGIRIYDRWENDANAFGWWVLTNLGCPITINGERATLDRINNDGHYVPGNLRWATYSQQAYNRGHSEVWF